MISRTYQGVAASILISAALLLGGASAGGFIANLMLQLLSIGVLLYLVWSRPDHWPSEAAKILALVTAFGSWVGFTLIPVPPLVWTALPGREPIAGGFALLGLDLPWLPISLAPWKTLASVVALLPPLALFVLTVRLSSRMRLWVVLTMIAVAAISCLLGFAQLFSGPASGLRPYSITSFNRAVGFFANSNFFVSLMLCALPLTGAAYQSILVDLRNRRAGSAWAFVFGGIGMLFVIGIAINGSIAGYVLAVPAVLCGLVLATRRFPTWLSPPIIGAGFALSAILLAAAIVVAPTDGRIGAKFSEDPLSRRSMVERSMAVAWEAFPVGTGLGSFQEAYRRGQDPKLATTIYVNHAHNDYAEILLELGLVGLLLVAAALWWWWSRLRELWSANVRAVSGLGQAGIAALSILIVQSLVDYPLRTSALACIAALCCALATTPPPARRRKREERAAREEISLAIAVDEQ